MILRALTLNGDVLESTFYDQATGAPKLGYSVKLTVLDTDTDEKYECQLTDGFPTLELATEFARRWVRDSVEELRADGWTPAGLRNQWFTFGEDAVVIGGNWKGLDELDHFVRNPATPEERDW